MTDINGTVKWDAAYEPFGKINEFATQTITNNFRFPGQYEDSMTGMYYNWNRYYMPDIGIYNRVDPQTSITKELYYYAGNNPIVNSDFMGLYCACSLNELSTFYRKYDTAYNNWLAYRFHFILTGNCSNLAQSIGNWGRWGCRHWSDRLVEDVFWRVDATTRGCCTSSTERAPQDNYHGGPDHELARVRCCYCEFYGGELSKTYDPYNYLNLFNVLVGPPNP